MGNRSTVPTAQAVESLDEAVRGPTGEEAEKARLLGVEAFAAEKYFDAVYWFTESILCCPGNPVFYGNRSAAFAKVHRHLDALDDAAAAVSLDASYAKGYSRKGHAEFYLGRYVDAEQSYRSGLALDPENQFLREGLTKVSVQPPHRAATAVNLLWDRLFDHLENPENLEAFIEENIEVVELQLTFLTQTLHVDSVLLQANAECRDSYDRAVFACGQLLSYAPVRVSRLKAAPRLVQGMGCALRVGWDIHHGVAKFAANSLVILATTATALAHIRREAVRHLLGGMTAWLKDVRPVVKVKRDDDADEPVEEDVCGCSCMRPCISATCWIDRLLQPQVPSWVLEEVGQCPTLIPLVVELVLVVRDRHGNPMALTQLLQISKVCERVMESTYVTGLHVVNELPGDPTSAPHVRLGEWVLGSLAYLLHTIDGDAVFAASTCRALAKLCSVEGPPSGLQRLLDFWVSIPLCERLAELACEYNAALQLLELIAQEPKALCAIWSLATALVSTVGAPASDNLLTWSQFYQEVIAAVGQETVGTFRQKQVWPTVEPLEQDLAQAWALLELAGKSPACTPEMRGEISALAAKLLSEMDLPEKKVWLARRMYRVHRNEEDEEDWPLAFTEWDREADALGQLCDHLDQKTGLGSDDLSGHFEVRFLHESSAGGAVLREWLCCVAEAFLKAEPPLLSTEDGVTYRPSLAAMWLRPRYADEMQLLGRVLGLAVWHQIPLGISLDPACTRSILGLASCPDDDAAFDATYLAPLRDHSLAELGLEGLCFTTFVHSEAPLPPAAFCTTGARWTPVLEDGEARIRLQPWGERESVTEANKHEYLAELWEWRQKGCAPMLAQIVDGMSLLLPRAMVQEVAQVLSVNNFSDVVAGEPGIDLDDWERNTLYTHGYTRESPPVQYFWQAMRAWEHERPELLRGMLHFATGTLRVPAGGFSNLQGHQGSHKFAIARAVHLRQDALPVVHACICTMDWPEYGDFDTALAKLKCAIELGARGFDEAAAHNDL